ncbi:uroporphyrinogen-III synthase [Christiangramia sabulilitoris]|uniref:Uroporphyrinogen-III synthase n=1 Tax=Christiangramia sabulilitoris TaxID=2583991 RepID=A0A550I8K7_9FLAO|nr:uroporphyrinogen-III synthase [Christiangramia sabulilitoris]TRO67305.1 uroporphyrinogen-III synthase [Christiangramia sabulilitoris]
MPTVLSTKKLALNQKELLLNSGIGIVEYDAISIEFIDFQLESLEIEYAIFTSKNAVKAVEGKLTSATKCFCVGEKTSAYARDIGFQVLEQADNASKLANILIQKYRNGKFHFFSGNKRREELPALLKENNIAFAETKVYNTHLNKREFKSQFDGILFFSPSAVISFTATNKLETKAFCIGETTASEARKHTDKIIVANKPGIENVIAKVVANLKNH